MLVLRLWRQGVSGRLSQKSRFVAHEETTHSVFFSMSLHSEGFFAGRNLGSGCTRLHNQLHGFTPLLKEGFFSEKESGLDHVMPVCARLFSADIRRCFCTSDAQNVSSFDLHPDEELATWEEKIKPYVGKYSASKRDIPLLHQDFSSVRKAAYASAEEYNLHPNGAVADGIDDPLFSHANDMGAHVTRNTSLRGVDTQTDRKQQSTTSEEDQDGQGLSLFQYDAVVECLTFEAQEGSDTEDGEQIVLSELIVERKDQNVFTPEDRRTVKVICKLLNSKGWTSSTKETLEKEYSAHLSHAVVAAVVLQQKNVSLASSIFEWACNHMGHNFRIYHAYLVRLGETKHFDEMWVLLSKMKENGVDISGITFCMMIRACGVAGVPAMAVDAFKRAHEYGIMTDIRIHRALLTVLFESNLVEEAKLFYSYMVQEGLAFDTHVFNTLIKGFNLFSAMEDAKSSFDTMLKEGWEPNILTYNGLIEGYCSVRAIENAMSTFSDLQRRGLKPTASTVNLLLDAFFKMGRVNDAFNFFASMSTVCTPNKSTFNILLHGMFLCKQNSKALSLFSLMEKEGLTNRLTYIYLASGLRGSKQTESARQLLKTLFEKHGYGIREVCIALLENLCRSGKLNEAEILFNGMLESSQEPCVPSFAIMICFYSRLGMLDRALELSSDLKVKGRRPTVYCYLSIIVALLKASRMADASKCFQELLLNQKYEGNAFICDYLLRELCKHGMTDDALYVVNTILSNQVRIPKPTLKELMKCLCKVGKIEEANLYFRALYKQRCFLLTKGAAQQAFGVMDVMGCSSNEKDRVSTCASL